MNVFTLSGELRADTKSFERSMREAEAALKSTEQAIGKTEQRATSIGKTSATTARQFEKFNETIQQQRQRLLDAAEAYQKGDIGAKRFAAVIGQTETKVTGLNSKLKDTRARLTDFASGVNRVGSGLRDVFGGALLAGGVVGMSLAVKNLTEDSVRLFGTLDKLTRFTATLDKNFQSPENLEKFREDIKKLSTEIPHSAESIAKASFTLKSAFSDLTQSQLIDYLREFGNQATASNTDIATHAFNMAALAKQYKFTAAELPKFGALMSSAFGKALAEDSKVSQGFNRVLASAVSLKQPIGDLAAAMGTLQGVSSDAENNTTLLLNVYQKLTDKKYIAGIQAMGVAVFDTAGKMRPLNDIVNDLANKLKGLNDQQVNDKLAWAKDAQAREGLKSLIRGVDEYNKTLKDGADEEAFAKKNELMLNSVEARWATFVNRINNFKMSLGGGVVDIIDDAKSLEPPKNWNGEMWRGVITKGLRTAVMGAYFDVQPIAARQGTSLGENLASGMRIGIVGGQAGVISAAIDMATRAYQGAKDILGIQSPSKVFMKIGEDVAQGFINGMAVMKKSVNAAMADLVDVTKIKGLTKKDAPMVGLIRDLIEELNSLNPLTAMQIMLAEIEAGKYGKVNKELRAMAVLLQTRIDKFHAFVKLQERFRTLGTPLDLADLGGDLGEGIGQGTGVGTGFSLPDPTEAERSAAAIKEMFEEMRKPIFPPFDPWNNFWAMMQNQLAKFRDSLPSMKEAIGVNLISTIEGIGDVFANAISRWDGTAQGFFKSIARGFADMARQIIAELIRIAVMKAVLQLIGSFAGGGGGSASLGHEMAHGFASGGRVQGPGSSTSDSIAALLSDGEFVMSAKAVKKWGVGFMERLNSGFPVPQMQFAGGGTVGGSSVSNNSWSPTFIVNVSGGANPQMTGKQIARAAMDQMNREQMRNK